jgi:hypothetical protein
MENIQQKLGEKVVQLTKDSFKKNLDRKIYMIFQVKPYTLLKKIFYKQLVN